MTTLCKLHDLGCDMHITWTGEIPSNYREYSRQHSFCWELNEQSANFIRETAKEKIVKSHILPTDRNIDLLSDTKKVFLRKDPEKIIESYFRGHFTGVYPIKISEFKNVENYYHKLKNRDAFKKSLPKDINDPLEKIKV